ncbi:MAG: large repetitive protein [Thermoanaerobaculia bacterium]|jgi:hypothetical protein|nr:large repetitive protein [Thermoanaerobaculia bacterium]
MRIAVRLLIVLLLLAAAGSLHAITYIVPSDRDLARRAEAIVIATAVESHSELRGERLVTVANLQVERVIKGSIGDDVQLVELGGTVGERMTLIPGAPRYENSARYLVFLRSNQFGEWVTYGFELGQFKLVSDLYGRELLTRGMGDGIFGLDESDGALHTETLRDANVFVSFVKSSVISEAPARADYFVKPSDVIFGTFPEFQPHTSAFVPHIETTRPDYLSSGNFRWQNGGGASFVHCCSAQTGGTGLDGPSAASGAMAAWNGAGAGVSYSLSGQDLTANKGFTSDGKNGILFNDPNNEVGTSGAVAIGGISNASVSYSNLGDGFSYVNTTEVEVVTGKNLPSFVGQSLFTQLITHELGHTLGFRHSDQTAANNPNQACNPNTSPCAAVGQAIMASTLPSPNSIGSLGQWDSDAVNTVYGHGPICNAPGISTQPASQSINLGSQASLSVVATGTSPFTYQWFVGSSGTTTTPVGTNSANFNPSPTTTTSYWVRVTGCNSLTANSNTAVVTVTCNAPSAPAPVASPTSIAAGQSSTISESPTGSGPFTYQWYSGNSGQTGNPIGGATSNNSITVSPSATTSYWVRVTGQCAPPADSPATTVTVNPCVPPTASTPFASPGSINTGQSSTISVSASGTGPFTYQWYSGNSGQTGSPIGGATSNNFITVSPTADTKYWVRVTGFCAPPSDSPAVTVTVTCSAISSQGVTAQPSTITNGNSSFLSFTTVGSGPFTIQWYTGNVGDTSRPIPGANSTSTIVSPTSNTIYWVRVTAPCGTQDGSTIVFVLGTQCTPASITTQPASSTIASGAPVTLTVVAAGTAPLTYQWYIGDKGDTSNLISGATSASLTRSPTATTKFWVRVSGCNSSTADSNTATITVSTCTAPSITTQPANVSAPIGTAATLKVVAAGTAPLHYQWYEGAKGNTTKTVGTDSSTFVTGAINSTIQYWVRITGQCGTPADSNTATIAAIAPPRTYAVRH